MHQVTKGERMLGRRSRWLGLGVMLVGLLGCGTGGDDTSTGKPGGTEGGGHGGVGGGMGGNPGTGAGGSGATGGGGSGGGTGGGEVVLPQGTSLFIEVKDPAGKPIPNAKVIRMEPMKPLEPRTTDALGRILFENLSVGRFVAQVRAEGHSEASAVVELKDGMHAGKLVVLHPFTQALPIVDLGTESIVEQGGVHVTIPADAMVDANGNSVTGPASVTIIPLDPRTDGAKNMPGPLEGTMAPNEPFVRLESVFMAEVTVWKDGQELQLAPGKHATLTFDIPQSLQGYYAPGTTIPSWSFDAVGGVWRKEGEGVVQWSTAAQNKLVWSAETYHFSWHNCDNPLFNEQYCYTVRVLDPVGDPVNGTYVYSQGTAGPYSDDADYTWTNGEACISVKMGTSATITVGYPWDVVAGGPVTVNAPNVFQPCGGAQGCELVTIQLQSSSCTPGSWADCIDEYPDKPKHLNAPCKPGIKYCESNGSGFTACGGEVLPQPTDDCQTSIDEDCDGQVNAGCPPACQLNDQRACYTGPANTRYIGSCHDGFEYCIQIPGSTTWGPCTGDQTPYNNEVCYPTGWGWPEGDYDCDGKANRLLDPNESNPNHPNHSNNAECTCWAWELKFDYPQDANVIAVSNPYIPNNPYPNSICEVGYSYCEENWQPSPAVPTFWQNAWGWTSPGIEECSAGNTTDEDCDGLVNEDGWFCCTPGNSPTGCTLENACQTSTCSGDHECTYNPVSTPAQTAGDCQTIMCALDVLKLPHIAYAEVPLADLNDKDDINDCTSDSCICANMACTEYTPKHDSETLPHACIDTTRPAASMCNEFAECIQCFLDSDCAAGLHCFNGECFSCTDTTQYCTNFQCYSCNGASCLPDGSETDVNCGGPVCAQCADGNGCLDGSDCTSQVCDNGVCQVPTCKDCCKNGNETGTNCGGGTCPTCGNGGTCNGPSDCKSNNCTGGFCVAPGCNNNMMFDPLAGETDVDCGGLGCDACAPNKHCLEDTDCLSTVCINNGTPMDPSDDYCQ